jgi:hypothetical protein
MTIPLRLEDRAEVQPARGFILREYLLPVSTCQDSEGRSETSISEIAFRILAAFRSHPHITSRRRHRSFRCRAALMKIREWRK